MKTRPLAECSTLMATDGYNPLDLLEAIRHMKLKSFVRDGSLQRQNSTAVPKGDKEAREYNRARTMLLTGLGLNRATLTKRVAPAYIVTKGGEPLDRLGYSHTYVGCIWAAELAGGGAARCQS